MNRDIWRLLQRFTLPGKILLLFGLLYNRLWPLEVRLDRELLPVQLVTKKGNSLYMRPFSDDAHVILALLGEDIYRCQNDVDGATVVDVGAHIGAFTLYVLEAGADKVVSCEPYGPNVVLLNRMAQSNPRILVLPTAVSGNSTGLMPLQVNPIMSKHSTYLDAENDSMVVLVPVTTLEEVFKLAQIERCDLLKLNCEGAELDIFQYLSSDTLGKVRKVIVACHPFIYGPKGVDTIVEKLTTSGFLVSRELQEPHIMLRGIQ